MSWISPLTDEAKRRRRGSDDVLADGERVGFDLAFRDSSPAPGRMFFTDQHTIADAALASVNTLRVATGRSPHVPNVRQQEILDEVARAHAEKQRQNDAAVTAAIERYVPKAKLTVDSQALANGAAVRDAIRSARYGG